jgi:hypothetical protein
MFYRHLSYKGRAFNPAIADFLDMLGALFMAAAWLALYLTAAYFCN